MNKTYRLVFFILLAIAAIVEGILLIETRNMDVLNPKGIIAAQEMDILIIATLLMLIIVIPVLVLTFTFIWRYRADNTNAEYDPNWNHSTIAEIIWWGFPCAIVIFLSVITWISTYDLDPFKPLVSDEKPLTVQVIALQYKWLFLYPEQNIASLNFLQIPENTPIHFEITSDAPMNSFWIPQLGGQIYAMPGMKTELHLMADSTGDFRGSSANLSGEGFAAMNFVTRASSKEDFSKWVETAQASENSMTTEIYNQLVEPSMNNPVTTYLLKEKDLFEQTVMKYMMPPK